MFADEFKPENMEGEKATPISTDLVKSEVVTITTTTNTNANTEQSLDYKIQHPTPEFLHEAKLSYWKTTICITALPFLCIGFPAHLFFTKSAFHPSTPPPPKKIGAWFKWIFNCRKQPFWSIVLSVITLVMSVALFNFVIYAVLLTFYQAVVFGLITDDLSTGSLYLFRSVPPLIPVMYGWLKGHDILQLLNSFDLTRLELKYEVKVNPDVDFVIPAKKRKARAALVRFYFLLFASHLIHLAGEMEEIDFDRYLAHLIDIMHNLVLTVYCSLCWVILSELDILSRHLIILQSTAAQPSNGLFINLKNCYKKILPHPQAVNDVFKKFITWVMIICLASIIAKIMYGSFHVFGTEKVFATIQKMGMGLLGFPVGEVTGEDAVSASPDAVRCAMAYYIAAVIQIFLLYFTYAQATKVNREVMYLQVLLNDYVSEVGNKMNQELYHSYRLLKFYMHSTNEHPRSAMLKLPILTLVPPIKAGLQTYKMRS